MQLNENYAWGLLEFVKLNSIRFVAINCIVKSLLACVLAPITKTSCRCLFNEKKLPYVQTFLINLF